MIKNGVGLCENRVPNLLPKLWKILEDMPHSFRFESITHWNVLLKVL